jgi:hypothetical protein
MLDQSGGDQPEGGALPEQLEARLAEVEGSGAEEDMLEVRPVAEAEVTEASPEEAMVVAEVKSEKVPMVAEIKPEVSMVAEVKLEEVPMVAEVKPEVAMVAEVKPEERLMVAEVKVVDGVMMGDGAVQKVAEPGLVTPGTVGEEEAQRVEGGGEEQGVPTAKTITGTTTSDNTSSSRAGDSGTVTE